MRSRSPLAVGSLALALAASCARSGGPPPTPPPTVAVAKASAAPPADMAARSSVVAHASYAGSEACKGCHSEVYARWSRTRMANVVRDPKVHPDAILPDLSQPSPLVTFGVKDIAFVYGSRWKQRYFTRIGDDYYPLPAQWDVTHRTWKPYFVADGTDWWVPFYPADNLKRPTGALCDGCHSVSYDVQTKQVNEWNVGCEKCHGAGGEHVKAGTAATIVDPAHLDDVGASDVCIQCHSQGRTPLVPAPGKAYDWPVGFRVGLSLKDYWQLEEHRPGQASFTHFADGTGHKNRMQGNDFVESLMYSRGVTCASCHDVHGTENAADLRLPGAQVCTLCHAPGGKNGPRAATLEAHTHHAAGSTGSDCLACHMPKIEQTIGDVMVRSHTFRFVPPSLTEQAKVPNPCTTCHAGKSTGWAKAALRSWGGASPWRVGE